MPEIALEPRPGDSVGPYRITRVIGRGRMGIVFEGVADGGDPVAIKVVTTELSQDEVFLRRFRREVAAAQKIQHANVVPVLAHGDEGGLPYLVQRLIPGGSLADRIAAEGMLGLETTVELLSGAAAGIDALHAGGLVHRDIKPGNILLDGEIAYVSDFGLAKDSQASNLTRPGQALGSLDYMAPEQIRGEEVSPATDIYALGCVDRTSAYRHAAVRRTAEHARALRAPAGPAARPHELRRDLSTDVSRAVARAMEKEAVERPASAVAYVASVSRAAGM